MTTTTPESRDRAKDPDGPRSTSSTVTWNTEPATVPIDGQEGQPKSARQTPVVVQMLQSPTGLVAITYLVLLAAACFSAPLLAPYDPLNQDLTSVLQGPSAAHWLGTDYVGRDVLTRLLYGGQITVIGVVEAVLTALVIGVPVGVVSGYHGKLVDSVVSRAVDVMQSIPGIIILLMVLAIFGSNPDAAMVTLGVLFSPGVVRIARGATIATRGELYVAAAKVAGLNALQTMRRHILPRISGPVIVNLSLLSASALLIQSGLSFLGLGVQAPNPSWGGMVAEGGSALRQQPWLILPSGAIIGLTVLAFVLVGDALRDATQGTRSSTVDPRRLTRRVAQNLAPAGQDAEARCDASDVLVVKGLSIELPLRAGWTRVVDQVSFSVRPGETLGLVGESGCGKTVTALGILGLVGGGGRIATGSILFRERDLAQAKSRDLHAVRGKEIAYISQEPMVSLDPSYTVGSQLLEAIRQHEKMSRQKARRRVIELLEQTGIPDAAGVAKKYPHQISGGMAQRVVIARALAGRPTLLITDEPTTALDSTVQREILALLRGIQVQTGMAIILVTHDWGVVAETCDRAVVMYAGQVVEGADVDGLFHDTSHPYTDGLLKANPHLVAEGERIVTIEGTVPSPASWPVGCRFADRCPLAVEACRKRPIELLEVAPSHTSRCIRVDVLESVNA